MKHTFKALILLSCLSTASAFNYQDGMMINGKTVNNCLLVNNKRLEASNKSKSAKQEFLKEQKSIFFLHIVESKSLDLKITNLNLTGETKNQVENRRIMAVKQNADEELSYKNFKGPRVFPVEGRSDTSQMCYSVDIAKANDPKAKKIRCKHKTTQINEVQTAAESFCEGEEVGGKHTMKTLESSTAKAGDTKEFPTLGKCKIINSQEVMCKNGLTYKLVDEKIDVISNVAEANYNDATKVMLRALDDFRTKED
ncbi:MAG: hypothetical protein BM556_10575 [Bacteriovorax sp. MedPE-SWde]|nr:MAG: hypothetical protein BM556_10575 [Bacteriovorax sp. MedPE-SWde]